MSPLTVPDAKFTVAGEDEIVVFTAAPLFLTVVYDIDVAAGEPLTVMVTLYESELKFPPAGETVTTGAAGAIGS